MRGPALPGVLPRPAVAVVIEKHLILLVHPVELEVHHANGLPVIGHLATRAVYNMRYFVGHYEFEVLYSPRREAFSIIIYE